MLENTRDDAANRVASGVHGTTDKGNDKRSAYAGGEPRAVKPETARARKRRLAREQKQRPKG